MFSEKETLAKSYFEDQKNKIQKKCHQQILENNQKHQSKIEALTSVSK